MVNSIGSTSTKGVNILYSSALRFMKPYLPANLRFEGEEEEEEEEDEEFGSFCFRNIELKVKIGISLTMVE